MANRSTTAFEELLDKAKDSLAEEASKADRIGTFATAVSGVAGLALLGFSAPVAFFGASVGAAVLASALYSKLRLENDRIRIESLDDDQKRELAKRLNSVENSEITPNLIEKTLQEIAK